MVAPNRQAMTLATILIGAGLYLLAVRALLALFEGGNP